MTDLININQYYRIRHGKVERVREHMRKRWRWTKSCGPLPIWHQN